ISTRDWSSDVCSSDLAVTPIQTANRGRNSIGVGSLRRMEATVVVDDNSLPSSDEETRTVLQEVLNDETLPIMAIERVANSYLFRSEERRVGKWSRSCL